MSPRFSLSYYDPPPALRRYALALFHFSWDVEQIHDRHPGALPQLTLFPQGSGEITFDGRTDRLSGEVHMLSGFSKAAPYSIKGPWHAIGISLTHIGWAALTGEPSSRWVDRFLPAERLLGDEVVEFAAEINARYRDGSLSGKGACDKLADWVAPRFGKIFPAHEIVIDQTLHWLGASLNPDVDDLFQRLSYSRRQTERLVERYFGYPPAALARKFRAIRAASLLSQEELSDAAEAEIAEAFYDQPHMVREIRRYCGETPTRLGGPADPLFQKMLKMKNLDRLEGFRSRS